MQINYTVHTSNVEDVPMRVKMGDRELNAMVPGITVELLGVGEHRSMGHTFKFIPASDDDMEAHKQLFTVGNTIKASFEKGE